MMAHAHYDHGYSGGSTERPALQWPLVAIGDRRIDVVGVYKVDRLTRSDFARIAHSTLGAMV
jgi:DNA invertase Pin-like site-specific DNA recombinase